MKKITINKTSNPFSRSKLAILLLLLSALFLYNCQENHDGILSPNDNSDAQLEAAIQSSTDKENITSSQLPIAALQVIESEYTESFISEAILAPNLGYQVTLQKHVGSSIGEKFKVFFKMDGQQINNGKKGKNDRNKIKQNCFTLVHPVTFIMPDGSLISGDSREEIKEAMKAWYDDNPGTEEKPELQFPVEIMYEDGTTVSVESKEDLQTIISDCVQDFRDTVKNKKVCFDLVFPVTHQMPDGFTITADSEEEMHLALREWHQANPEYEEKPTLVFPVDIVYEDGTIVTINSTEEMKEVIKECRTENKGNKGNKGNREKQKACFELQFPVTHLMPDNSTITSETKEEWLEALKNWRELNPDITEKPELQFPVDIVLEDGTIITINNQEEMKEAFGDCKKGNGKRG